MIKKVKAWGADVEKRLSSMNMRQRGIIIVYMMMLLVAVVQPMTVKADYNWAAGADSSIYEGDGDSGSTEAKESGKPSWLEKNVSKLLLAAGDQLEELFNSNGISINRVLFGRVNGFGDNGIAYYTYELSTGNPYGVISMMIYRIMARMMFVCIVCIIMFRLVQAMYSSGSAQARANLKETMKTCLLSFLLLSIMPSLLTIMLYLRDVFVYSVSGAAASIGIDFTSSGGVVGAFRDLVEGEGLTYQYKFVPAAMYLGIVVITLYFMFEYVGMAMGMMVMVICFPFITIEMNFDKGSLSTWLKSVVSVLITPIMDIMLFMLPLAFGSDTSHAILHLTMCALIIPSRNVIKQVLGLSSPGSGILSGLAALTVMRSAGNMLRRAGGIATGAAGAFGNAYSDYKKGSYHKKMGEAEAADRSERLRRNGVSGYDPVKNSEQLSKQTRKNKGFGVIGKDGFGKKSRDKKESFADTFNRVKSGQQSRLDKFGANMQNDTDDGIKSSSKMGRDYDSNVVNMADRMNADASTIRRTKNDLQRENSKLDTRLSKLNAAKTVLTNRRNVSEDPDERQRLSTQIGNLDKDIGNCKVKKAKNNEKIANLSATESNLRAAGAGIGGGAGSGQMGKRQSETLAKLATISNFETPEFSNLSHNQKASLYRKRAIANLAKSTVKGAAGVTGAAVGSALGVGASTFMGVPASAATIELTTEVGNAVGAFAGGAAAAAGVGAAGKIVKKVAATRNVNVVATNTVASDMEVPNIDISGVMNGGAPITHTVNVEQAGVAGTPIVTYSGGNNGVSGAATASTIAGVPTPASYHINVQSVVDSVVGTQPSQAVMTNVEHVVSSYNTAQLNVPHSNVRAQASGVIAKTMVSEQVARIVSDEISAGRITDSPEIRTAVAHQIESTLMSNPKVAAVLQERANVLLTEYMSNQLGSGMLLDGPKDV